jgi:GDPmannose 4,6-dehydratase
MDGHHLSSLLLDKDYEVYGMIRRTSDRSNLDRIDKRIKIIPGDMNDCVSLVDVMQQANPDEVYNLAGQSFVGVSWQQPIVTHATNSMGAVRLFEAARLACPNAKIYQASSSEMFGSSPAPQNEETPFAPRSPYAVSKCAAHWSAKVARESYGQFISCGVLFNHSGPRRGGEFVERKITQGLARISRGQQNTVRLGNMTAKRDWGFAGDHCQAMWLMLQQDKPDDFVIGTGETHSVQEFWEAACKVVGEDPRHRLLIDQSLFRPAEVNELRADFAKARRILGWEPKVGFQELVEMMVKADLVVLA